MSSHEQPRGHHHQQEEEIQILEEVSSPIVGSFSDVHYHRNDYSPIATTTPPPTHESSVRNNDQDDDDDHDQTSTLLSQFITHRSLANVDSSTATTTTTTTSSTQSSLSHQMSPPSELLLTSSSSSNGSTTNNTSYRKQLYQSCVFTYQVLVIQGIYSYFLDYSIFILMLRLFQSFVYHYSFVYSYGKPTLLGRIFKDMRLIKRMILIIITLLPIVYIHVSNYLSNKKYYSRTVEMINDDTFVLIDFFERDHEHYRHHGLSEEPFKIGVFSINDQSVTVHGTHETKFVENLGETRSKTTEEAVIDSVHVDMSSNRMFDSHPTLFVIYLCLFDVLFAILQVSYVTSLISLKKKPTQQQIPEENNSMADVV